VRINCETTALTVASGALGIIAALTLSIPTALADPVPPAPAPAPAPVDPTVPGPGPLPGPAPDGTLQATAGTLPTPPDGMQHLSSPENLPPGTTETPPEQAGGGSYLRDLWHAYQTQEISGRDALLLLSQRPMDSAAVPPGGLPAHPTPPLGPNAATPPAPDAPPPPAPEPPPPPPTP
jgi:hypothetical protein